MAADPARWPVQALRPRLVGKGRGARPGDARGRAPRLRLRPAADQAGRSRSPETRCSRCARPPTRRRSVAAPSFSLAAFRQAFAAGRDLTEPDNVLLAAAAAEMHPRAVLSAIERDVGQAQATRGDRSLPAIWACAACPASWSASRSSGATTAWRRPPRYREPAVAKERTQDGGAPRSRRWQGGRRAPASGPSHLPRAARDDGVDPPLRGGGRAPVPAGQGRRLPASGDRRGGDDRRHHLGDAPRRLPDRHLPHPRPRDRPRHRPEAGDGGAVRARGRLLARSGRLDAHLRPRAPLHGRLRDRRRQPPDRRRARPGLRLHRLRLGHRLHVRRRCLEHRQLRRDDEPRGAVEAAGRLPGREQPLRHGDGDRAPLGGHRPVAQGRGAGRGGGPRRRDGRACGAGDGRRAHPHRP